MVSTRDLQFLHAAAQGVRMQVEDPGGAVRSFDDPACLLEHRQDVALFDRCKRQGLSRLSAGPGTCRIAVTPRLTRSLIWATRSHGGDLHRAHGQQRAVQSEVRPLTTEEVIP